MIGFRFVDMVLYQGVSWVAVLCFEDTTLLVDKVSPLKNYLKKYTGHMGDVIETQVIYDKNENKVLVYLTIICYNLLLEDVSRYKYNQFIKKHQKDFIQFYQEQLLLL